MVDEWSLNGYMTGSRVVNQAIYNTYSFYFEEVAFGTLCVANR